MNDLARPSLLRRTAQMFAAQARVYCLSALIAGVLGITALTAMSLWIVHAAGEGQWDARAIWQSMTGSHQLLTIFGLVLALWAPILLAARGVCRITTDQLASQPVSLSKVLNDMLRFIPAALVYSLICGFTSMVGFSILIVPGIFIASLFVLVVPASTNESLGMFATLRRGITLSLRELNRTLLLTFASGVLVGILVVLRIVLLDRFIPSTYGSLFALRFALTYIPALLVLILANISFTLLYQEIRMAETRAVPGGTSPV
jgi:hypothetical protein